MTVAAQNLLKKARKLSPDDLEALARDIIKMIAEEDDDFELTDEQKKELLRREEAHRKNPNEGIPWEVVKAKMDAKYK